MAIGGDATKSNPVGCNLVHLNSPLPLTGLKTKTKMETANEALQKIRQKLNKLKKLDSNWLYNLRMNEAEQRRKQNFTKKQINSQLF